MIETNIFFFIVFERIGFSYQFIVFAEKWRELKAACLLGHHRKKIRNFIFIFGMRIAICNLPQFTTSNGKHKKNKHFQPPKELNWLIFICRFNTLGKLTCDNFCHIFNTSQLIDMPKNKKSESNPSQELANFNQPTENDAKYRSFIENLPVLFYAVAPNPPYSPYYVSPAFERFGHPLEDWTSDPNIWLRVIHPEDVESVFTQTTASTESGNDVDYEYRIVDANGRTYWVRDIGCLIRDTNGKVFCREGVILDICDRKLAEEALIISEEKYRDLFENANDIIYVHDLEGNYLSVNRASEQIFGYSREEALSMNMKQIAAPEHFERAINNLTTKLNGIQQTSYELDCKTKAGKLLTLEINSTVIQKNGVPVAVQGIARDITERKEAEEKLQESEEFNRSIINSSLDCIKTLDLDGKLLSMSNNAQSILCIDNIDSFLNKSWIDFWEGSDREAAREAIRSAASGKTGRFVGFFRRLDGEPKWWDVQISPILDGNGKPSRLLAVSRDITEGKKAEDALRESESNLAAAQRLTRLGSWELDINNIEDRCENIVRWSDEVFRIFGFEPKQFHVTSEIVYDRIHPDYQELLSRKLAEAIINHEFFNIDTKILLPCGEVRLVHAHAETIYDETSGKPIKMVGTIQDITERKKAEEALKNSEEQYRDLFENANDLIYTHSLDGVFTSLNRAGEKLTGYSREEAMQIQISEIVAPEYLDFAREMTLRKLGGELPNSYEIEIISKDGRRVMLELSTRLVYHNEKPVGVQGIGRDITSRRHAEDQLRYNARHDALTNLPNRMKFMEHLQKAVDLVKADPDRKFAVLFLDLDRFKIINDSLGHVIGDKLLIGIAKRLNSCIRPNDIVARLGGDEFTVLLNKINSPADATIVAERLQRKLAAPFKFGNSEVFTSASIGIIVSDNIKREAEDFLRDADTAMYRAKETGKARCEIFDTEMHVKTTNLLQLETDLRHALERGEFEVFYQPIVELNTWSIREFEALIRWHHPKHGLVSPNEFISVAEETGLIIPIGRWVMEEACRQIAEWQKLFSFPLSVSVNLSAKQILCPTLTEDIKNIIFNNSLNPRQLKLEVTESTVMEHSERSLCILTGLDALGVLLSTDDFGTGYSSLSYLQQFPFNRLKIDRTFIDKMATNEKSAAIVKTILMLGDNLNIEVVAEGIETENQLEMLARFGCRKGQGFLFSKPVVAKRAEEFLNEACESFNAVRSRREQSIPFEVIESGLDLRIN